ncbi:MAG: ABC transporter substrate-binding protein [Rhodocyclaceae bacterium]
MPAIRSKPAARTVLACLAALLLPLAHAGVDYREAPSLTQEVRAGKLPPVEQRLPARPEIVKPLTRPGSYGGVIRTAIRSNGDQNAILRLFGAQGLVRWGTDFASVVPNVAESWTTNNEQSEFTFRLRHGMRWSDGAPFTADDVLFAINDLVADNQFFTITPSRYVIKDKVVVAEKIDNDTVRLKFAGSYRRFLEELATPPGQHPVMYPKHYCSQFHPKYNPRVLELAHAERLNDWVSLMRLKCGDIETPTRWGNPAKPTLDPWIIKEPYTGGSTRVLAVRNPYFWQVDTLGQQLPYIDSIRFQGIAAIEAIVLAAVSGQLDFQIRYIGEVHDRALINENAARGGYTTMLLPDTPSNVAGIYLNYSTKNAAMRELFRQRDFRIALSLGLDRPEINELVFMGRGEGWQIGPLPQNRFFNERLSKQFTERDVARANALLDGLGLSARDSEGYRQRPGGGRVSFGLAVPLSAPMFTDIASLMRRQLRAIGIDMVPEPAERSLYGERIRTNEYDAALDSVTGGMDPTLDMRSIVSIHAQESKQSLPWVRWYESNGKSGEEPLPNMKKRLELYDRWQLAKTDREADALFREILQLAADEFDVIGTIRSGKFDRAAQQPARECAGDIPLRLAIRLTRADAASTVFLRQMKRGLCRPPRLRDNARPPVPGWRNR